MMMQAMQRPQQQLVLVQLMPLMQPQLRNRPQINNPSAVKSSGALPHS